MEFPIDVLYPYGMVSKEIAPAGPPPKNIKQRVRGGAGGGCTLSNEGGRGEREICLIRVQASTLADDEAVNNYYRFKY